MIILVSPSIYRIGMTAVLMLSDTGCLWWTVGVVWISVHESWLLLPWRPTSTSSSARPRLRPPGISRRPSSWSRGTGHWSSGVWGSQWHILLQINPSCCRTWLHFGRLAALLNYDIWEDKWSAKKEWWGQSGANRLIVCAIKEYVSVCVCVYQVGVALPRREAVLETCLAAGPPSLSSLD